MRWNFHEQKEGLYMDKKQGKIDMLRKKLTKGWPGWAVELEGWAEVLIVAAVLAWFLTQFIIINATVPSGSMQDTIQPGDRLFGLRLSYLFSEPKRGDIVVFHYPVDEALGKKTNFIKRIIGLPGETVDIKDAKIYIDGSETPLEEDYIMDEPWTVAADGFHFEIPDGCYLMLGDHRNNSKDSRYWPSEIVRAGLASSIEEAQSFAFVKRKQILGKAYLRYWPLTEITLLK